MEIRKASINHAHYAIAILLVFAGVCIRLLPHEPNFAPVGAIALFGGAVLGWRTALWLPVGVMMLSDLVIGFYPGIQFTWTAFLFVAGFGMAVKKLAFLPRTVLGAFGASCIFFVVSNFGVWATSGMYMHTVEGLWQCYVAAIPFFRMTLLGDAFYAVALFGVYEVVTRWVAARQTTLAAA